MAKGVDVFLDLEVIDPAVAERTRRLLQEAVVALEARGKG